MADGAIHDKELFNCEGRDKPTSDAKQVVYYGFEPADEETEHTIESFREANGIRRGKNQRRAICGFLATCKALQHRKGWYFAWPCSKASHSGYRAYKTVRDQLELKYFTLVKKGSNLTGKANTYKLHTMPNFGKLKFVETRGNRRLVEVRNCKERERDWSMPHKGKQLSRNACLSKFGEAKFSNAEERMQNVVSYLHDYPLVLNDIEYRTLWRQFNEGSMTHGGRIYGSYSPEKKIYRASATIDGERISQIDVNASFLFVRAAMDGVNLGEGGGYPEDPYKAIRWVDCAESRVIGKELVSMMISCGGKKKKFPGGYKAKHPKIIEPKQTISEFTGPIYEAFPFLRNSVDGLYVMYQESEAMMATLENCMEADIPAWPLHDCIFVRRRDKEKAIELLKLGFEEVIGYRPYISIEEPEDAT